MSLIICKECKKEISDTCKVCPNCGYKLSKNKRKNVKKIVIILVLLIIVFSTVGIILVSQKEQILYTKAISLMNEKKYEESKQIFQQILDYNDSREKLNIIENEIKKEHPGSITGSVTWKYNSYVGHKADVDAKVIAINTDVHEKENKYLFFESNVENGIYVTKVDGNGNYTIKDILPGNYYLFIISDNTRSLYANNGDFPKYIEEEISLDEWNSLINPGLSFYEFFDDIVIEMDEEEIISHDFGTTMF